LKVVEWNNIYKEEIQNRYDFPYKTTTQFQRAILDDANKGREVIEILRASRWRLEVLLIAG